MGVLLSSRFLGMSDWCAPKRVGDRLRSDAEHPAGRPLVRLGDVGLAPEPTGADAALLLQNVRAERLAPAQPAGGGHLDALGGAPVCLHLRHCVIPLRLML